MIIKPHGQNNRRQEMRVDKKCQYIVNGKQIDILVTDYLSV